MMKLQSLKTTWIAAIAIGAALATIPLAASAQSTPALTSATVAEHKPHNDQRANFGLLGLLGLLGLVGLRGRKRGTEVPAKKEMDDRPPAPPGSYVSDVRS
jgi:hypothetical protein